ncbi:aminotransferase class I/II-fold pyridoxal phosphate-dependent enzyme [Paractinoplanes pyxinae]|uniref:aminotransferase class I/II-fold pyridoxal phosphate-dependent enzyme n=1 Tax=Paractinoplanes pyxinae TaxID=2997416 RepID=UPI002D1E3F56|nr:aminotransferase class I/II-fold pyridoxal phosphate-dependent enzyme [Actinoplanes pyxinae]
MVLEGVVAGWLEALDGLAASRSKAGLTRRLRPRPAGDPVVDLAGNDYLGLAVHPAVVAASAQTLAAYGLGATGSRLVRGSSEVHAALESALASWMGLPAALVFSSGYLANLAAVRSLTTVCDLIVSDAYNHASLIDGCKISGVRTVVAPHNSPAAVAEILDTHRPARALVVTESVFSVDGDLAPLATLHEVTSARGALLLVDDAHALGLLGSAGAGGVAAAGLSGRDDVIVTATLSKSLGGAGGVVAGPAVFIQHLIDTGRTFIYDTALPPAVAAGVHEAVRIAQAADDRRALLRARARQTVTHLTAAGLQVVVPTAAQPTPPAMAPADDSPAADSQIAVSAAGRQTAAGSQTTADAAGPQTATPAAGVRTVGPRSAVPAVGTQADVPAADQRVVAPAADLQVAVPVAGVLSVMAPGPEAALVWADDCRDRGVAVGCFRPPSTPDGSSRLRLTLNAGVSDADFARALDVIVECAP